MSVFSRIPVYAVLRCGVNIFVPGTPTSSLNNTPQAYHVCMSSNNSSLGIFSKYFKMERWVDAYLFFAHIFVFDLVVIGNCNVLWYHGVVVPTSRFQTTKSLILVTPPFGVASLALSSATISTPKILLMSSLVSKLLLPKKLWRWYILHIYFVHCVLIQLVVVWWWWFVYLLLGVLD